MAKPTVVDAAMKCRIEQLRHRNWGCQAIADELGISIGAVEYWCKVENISLRKLPKAHKGKSTYERDGVTVNQFLPEEDEIIREKSREGLRYTEIARILTEVFPARPRDGNTIRMRLYTLARREERYGIAA